MRVPNSEKEVRHVEAFAGDHRLPACNRNSSWPRLRPCTPTPLHYYCHYRVARVWYSKTTLALPGSSNTCWILVEGGFCYNTIRLRQLDMYIITHYHNTLLYLSKNIKLFTLLLISIASKAIIGTCSSSPGVTSSSLERRLAVGATLNKLSPILRRTKEVMSLRAIIPVPSWGV